MSEPRHFTLEPVADGVWAGIALPDRGAVGNAGIVDLGGRSLVFDTMVTPMAGRELREAAERLAGPVRWVVNSHWHGDHRFGNVSMPDPALIVSTPRTRELMARVGADRLAAMKRTWSESHADVEAELRSRGKDEEIELLREFVAVLPGFEPRLPDEVFEGRRVFEGPARAVELVTFGGGHTESDAFLVVPDVGVLLAGDLVVVDSHPWLGDGNPEDWPGILDRMRGLEFERVLPGHGPVAGRDALDFVGGYLAAVREAVADEGEDAEPPERYAELAFAEVWKRNAVFLAAR